MLCAIIVSDRFCFSGVFVFGIQCSAHFFHANPFTHTATSILWSVWGWFAPPNDLHLFCLNLGFSLHVIFYCFALLILRAAVLLFNSINMFSSFCIYILCCTFLWRNKNDHLIVANYCLRTQKHEEMIRE